MNFGPVSDGRYYTTKTDKMGAALLLFGLWLRGTRSWFGFRLFQTGFGFTDLSDKDGQSVDFLFDSLALTGDRQPAMLGVIGFGVAVEAVVAVATTIRPDAYSFQNTLLDETSRLRTMPLAAATRAFPHIVPIIPMHRRKCIDSTFGALVYTSRVYNGGIHDEGKNLQER